VVDLENVQTPVIVDSRLSKEGSGFPEPDLRRIQRLVEILLPYLEPEMALIVEGLLQFAYLKGRQDLCVYLRLADLEIQEQIRAIRSPTTVDKSAKG
jgi:Rad3-related DNA helicase